MNPGTDPSEVVKKRNGLQSHPPLSQEFPHQKGPGFARTDDSNATAPAAPSRLGRNETFPQHADPETSRAEEPAGQHGIDEDDAAGGDEQGTVGVIDPQTGSCRPPANAENAAQIRGAEITERVLVLARGVQQPEFYGLHPQPDPKRAPQKPLGNNELEPELIGGKKGKAHRNAENDKHTKNKHTRTTTRN